MNSFGRLFQINIYGESHGAGVGVVIDGCPPGIPLELADFETDLARRRSGKPGTTARLEADQPQLLSGVFEGKTTGAPIAIWFINQQQKTADYIANRWIFRPGHADFTAYSKYKGYNDWRGGGMFSGRLTVGLVAAGVIAKKIIRPMQIDAIIEEIGGQKNYDKGVIEAQRADDSLGGIITCTVENVPVGLGEPFFDSVESLLSHAIFAIPGIKGVAFGSGFAAARMRGSEYNDLFLDGSGKTSTNHAGGINGGITNGNPLFFQVAVHPTASIAQPQQTFDFEQQRPTLLQINGRHDVCFALRVPVIIEAVTACVLADLLLIKKAFD
jgi:chorismate synthase